MKHNTVPGKILFLILLLSFLLCSAYADDTDSTVSVSSVEPALSNGSNDGRVQLTTPTDLDAERIQLTTPTDLDAERIQLTTPTDLDAERIQLTTPTDLDAERIQLTTPTDLDAERIQLTTPTDLDAQRIQLATPTDLEWGTCPSGSTAWSCEEPKQERFYIEIYRQGTEDPLYSRHWSFPGHSGQYYSVFTFCTLDAETGDYYFTVKSVSSDDSYKDSGTAISPVWHYERPEAQLGACTNIQINNNGWTFCMPEDTTYVGGYETVIYYAASEYDTPEQAGATSMLSPNNSYSSSETLDMTVYDYCLEQHGAGYYSFKIRTLSKDITAAVSGPWSEISPAVYIGEDRYTLTFPNGTPEFTAGTTDNRLSATVGGPDPQTYYENYGSLIWKSSDPDVLSFTEEYGWSGSESSVKVQLNGVGTAYVTATTRDETAVSAGIQVVVHSASPATAPSDLKIIEEEAFENTNFEEIILKNGVVSIGSGAFKNCVNLKLITIPDSVTSIAEDAFTSCSDVAILCSRSSAAAWFARENGLTYVYIN